ncbi:MAG: DUF3761 domain-containing protein [SAR202 cluster bacterium]|nr:DUF3761 domain-containing protein [SAR202 cluster bacterium]
MSILDFVSRGFSSLIDRSCPKCGSGTILRTASRGQYKGRQFLGCSRYPVCRGLINLTDEEAREHSRRQQQLSNKTPIRPQSPFTSDDTGGHVNNPSEPPWHRKGGGWLPLGLFILLIVVAGSLTVYNNTPTPTATPTPAPTAIPTPTRTPLSPTALCKDGTYSYSQSRRGTCSWHGGVRIWY